MTECERQLQEMALSIQEARREAGCDIKKAVPEPSLDAIPNLGGEARSGDCLVSMLASGSKGNSAYIRCGKTNILIDAGISCAVLSRASSVTDAASATSMPYLLLTNTRTTSAALRPF